MRYAERPCYSYVSSYHDFLNMKLEGPQLSQSLAYRWENGSV